MRNRYYANFTDTNPNSIVNISRRNRGQSTSSGGSSNG